MIKENISIYEAIMSESSSLKFHLELLRLIPKNYSISSLELREKLLALGIERDLRSIQRALNTLCEQFEIDCNTNDKPYSYRWKPDAKGLDMPILNEQQSLVLMLAKQYLTGILPTNIMQSMDGFFKQAEYNLAYGKNQKKEASEWLNKAGIAPTSQPLLPAKIDPEVFNKVSIALYHNKYINMSYRKNDGNIRDAQVKPLALVQQGPSTYLVVQYESGAIRHLALHRFISVNVSTMQFERPKFSLKMHIESQNFGFSSGKKIRLTFRIDKETGRFLTETPLSTDQTVKDYGSEYEISATVIESAMLEWWIANFGEDYQEIDRTYLDKNT